MTTSRRDYLMTPPSDLEPPSSTEYDINCATWLMQKWKLHNDDSAFLPDESLKEMREALSSLKIVTAWLGSSGALIRTPLRLSVSGTPSRHYWPFQLSGGITKLMSLAEFYQNEHNHKLVYPQAPCVMDIFQCYYPCEDVWLRVKV